MKVSIVIRCYNEEEHIDRLLSGIVEQTIRDLEIIIVDSGSKDATVSIALKYPVRILSIPKEEFSFGRSLNIGCKSATGEFIVFASAHVYPVYKDWLESILKPFSDPIVALVYGKQRGSKVTAYAENQILVRWFPENSNGNQEHPFCNNANAAIRRSLWEKLPFDETLTGLEDIDWAIRAKQLGHRIAYMADAEIVHLHNESPKCTFNRYHREAIALKHIFPEERFTIWEFTRLFVVNVVSDCYHAWHDGMLWRNVLSIFIFRFMQFCGTYQGFRQRGPVTIQLRQRFYYPNGRTRRYSDIPGRAPKWRIQYVGLPAEEQVGRSN